MAGESVIREIKRIATKSNNAWTATATRLIDALDAERLAVAAALGARATPLPEHFHRMGYTTEAARDSGLAYEVFHQSGQS